jgi:hypothetical protein
MFKRGIFVGYANQIFISGNGGKLVKLDLEEKGTALKVQQKGFHFSPE